MGQSPFPAELATLATDENKENGHKAQGRRAQTPSTFQPLQQGQRQPWHACEALRDGV